MKPIKTVLLISLLLISSVAFGFGEKSKLEQARHNAEELVISAKKNGLEKVDGILLSEILVAIQKPQMFFMKGIVVQEESRSGGYYNNDQWGSRLLLDPKVFEAKSGARRDVWILHELLGAAGIDDKSYALSIQIARAAISGLSPFLLKVVSDERNSPDVIVVAGGGSVVGGGGDPDAITAKNSVLDFLESLKVAGLSEFEGVHLEKLAQLTLDCGFEFYFGQNAVKSIEHQRFYKTLGSGEPQILERLWITLKIRRDWLFAHAEPYADDVKMLVQGLATHAKDPKAVHCRPPSTPARYWSAAGKDR
jgi:hypothetical protein